MKKILTVTQSEFMTLVRTKAFVIGLVLMPVMMAAFFFFMEYARSETDTTIRTVAVIDGTGVLFDPLLSAADTRNTEFIAADGTRTGPTFAVTRVDVAGESLDAVKLRLSDQVRARELFAFLEIPADIIAGTSDDNAVRYYTETTSYESLPTWLRTTLNDEIIRSRFADAGIDQALVKQLNTRTSLSTFGLLERAADGTAGEAKEVDGFTRMALPIFFLALMFMAVMTTAQQLINAVIEEKMSKISEVLLGSVTPFQLLMGKLLGVVAVVIVLSAVYFVGGIWALVSIGRLDLLNPILIAWFLLFLVCAALLYGSIFLALGSACSDLHDAQSMMQPAMVLILLAYLGSFIVIQNPDSGLSVGSSFFPTMAPFAMLLRMAMPPGPPFWQVLLSVTLLIAATGFCVWAASRIFRVGILMQGKAPTLPELVKWIGK